MFTSEQLPELRRKIRAQAALEARVLDELVKQAAGLAPHVRPIRPRTATAVALTAADGGNNSVAFNPFELQVIRVVDSQGKELFLDVVSPATDIDELGRRHRGDRTVLGKLMDDLDAQRLSDLSSMMTTRNRKWVEVYRDLCEWATLHDLITSHQFAADTLIVRDGLLRTTIFAGDTLVRLGELMKQAIDRQAKDNRRRIWLAGLAKKTKVLDHYRLAISLAGIFDRGTPCFVPVPHELQERVYRSNADYVREPGDDESGADLAGATRRRTSGRCTSCASVPMRVIPSGPRTCSRGNGRTRRPSSATCRPTRRPDSRCRSTRSASSRPTRTPGSPTWTSTSSRTASSAPSASTSATARGTSLTRCCSPRRTSRRGATGYAALRPRRRRRRLPRLLRQRHGVPRRPGAPLSR